MKTLTWAIISFMGGLSALDTFASTVFDEDRGWIIRRMELSGEPYTCIAEKQIQAVSLSITPLMLNKHSFLMISVTFRQNQTLRGNELKVFFDEYEITLPRERVKLTASKIELLIDSADIDLNRIGTSQSLQLNLSPHTRIDLGSPTYATYLLEECTRTLDSNFHQSEMTKLVTQKFPSLSALASFDSDTTQEKQKQKQKSGDKSSKQKPAKELSLPSDFNEFVEAFTMIDPEKIKYLPIDEARTRYKVDWIESGWTGDSKLILGIGYTTRLKPEAVIEFWEKNRRDNCESLAGKFQQKNLGTRGSNGFVAHVGFSLCETKEGWMALTKTSYDMKSNASGITEVVAYDERHSEPLNQWFDELD